MLAQHLLNENLAVNLNALITYYTNLPKYDNLLSSYLPTRATSFTQVPSDILWNYAGHDAAATYMVYKELEPLLRKHGYDYIFYDIPAVWKEDQDARPDVNFWYKYNQPAYCRLETYLVGVAPPGSKNYTKIVEITWGFEIEHEEDIPRLDPVRIRYLQ